MREPDRWVVDTNVLVSRLLAPRGVAAQAVDQALQTGVLLVSDATLEELAEVLARPRFDPYLSKQDRQRFFSLLSGVSRRIPINQRVQACRDPKDDKFLDVALCGLAQGIVTGDKDLLALNPFHGVPILAPTAFLTR
jgi:uncharacterized protein